MALFLNLLIHPLDAQSQRDLELLVSTTNLVRSMPVHTLTHGEIERVQETGSFVMGLVWLGSCAIMKAERVRDQ